MKPEVAKILKKNGLNITDARRTILELFSIHAALWHMQV